jgi:hypothetical protein
VHHKRVAGRIGRGFARGDTPTKPALASRRRGQISCAGPRVCREHILVVPVPPLRGGIGTRRTGMNMSPTAIGGCTVAAAGQDTAHTSR